MRMRALLTAAALVTIGVGAVIAADDPVKTREGLMKQIGGSMGALAAIAKDQKPYDAEAVKAALTTISANAKAFPDQFPAGSDANSEASPKIWENMDDFKAKAAKLGADADQLLAQLPADAAGVGAAAGTLGQSCGGCHQLYRVKK